jgi:hypothetical protein
MAEVDARRAHIDAALEAAEWAGDELAWIRIADRLATHLQHRAIHGEARSWFEQARKRVEQLEPPHPALAAEILSNLALLLRDVGQAAEARPLLERAVAIAERKLPPGHPLRTKIAGNLQKVLAEL